MADLIVSVGATTGQYPNLPAAWAATPTDLVAADIGNLIFDILNEGEFVTNSPYELSGKTVDASHRITIRAKSGGGFSDNANVLTNRYAYTPANGVAIRNTGGRIINVNQDYITIDGLQLQATASGSFDAIRMGSASANCVLQNLIVESFDDGTFGSGVSYDSGVVRNTLVVMRGNCPKALYMGSSSARSENNTLVKPSDKALSSAPPGASGLAIEGEAFVVNTAQFGFLGLNNSASPGSGNNASSTSIPFGSNNKVNLIYADQFANTLNGTHDYRTKTGSGLIDSGATPNTANTKAPSGVRQQGTSADIGAWEYPSVVVAPTASITSISISGQNATITGTTTGTPTSGTVTVSPASTPYNGAVGQGPTSLTLGNGTFTATFNNLKVGAYSASVTVVNASFSATTNGTFNIVGALATSLIQDPIDGQVLTIHGNTSGNPTSGTLIVPAAASNPNGAIQQNVNLTLGSGTFTVSATLPPGNYDPGILQLTTAAGTSLPQSGTSAVSVMGFSGNPEAPGGDGSNPPATVTGVSVSPTTATGSTTFTATVSGTNSPSQAVTWSATAGSITSGGVFTAPAATGSVQTITVTATSIVDSTKSGTATVTIAASTGSTVTGVSVSPSTATVNGGSTRQFSATVSGTNSPSQAVNWSANGGSVSSAGLFTAPVATNSAQTFTVTATSVADGSKSGSATITVPALAAATRTITMPLATGVDIFNQPIPAVNLSGLSVAIYAQSTPGSASTVLYQTETGTTNGSGVFSASFQTLLQAGALVLVVILMPDGRHCASKVAIA